MCNELISSKVRTQENATHEIDDERTRSRCIHTQAPLALHDSTLCSTASKMLPLTLIYLLNQILGGTAQQTAFQLPLNNLANFTGNTLPNPPVLSIPSSQDGNLTVTVALCAPGPQTPRFILSNDSSITQPGLSDLGNGNVFELPLTNGFGNWTGPVPDGGFMTVLNAGRTPFEVAVSDDGTYL